MPERMLRLLVLLAALGALVLLAEHLLGSAKTAIRRSA